MTDIIFLIKKKHNLGFKTLILLEEEFKKGNEIFKEHFTEEIENQDLTTYLYVEEKCPRIRYWIESQTAHWNDPLGWHFKLIIDDLDHLKRDLEIAVFLIETNSEMFEKRRVINEEKLYGITKETQLIQFRKHKIETFYEVMNYEKLLKLKETINQILEDELYKTHYIGAFIG